MDLLKVGNLGAEWATMRTFCWEPMGGGEAETESLILWLVVLELLAVGWWWCEAQSYSGLAETHILYTWLWEHQPWGWVRLSDWVKEIHCVVKAEWKCIFIWFCDFLFFICFLFYYILCVKFLQNHQVMVTSLGLCCWSGRRIPQSSKCWSTCNIWGKMREGGEDDGKGMVSVIEGVQSLGGREMSSPMRDGIVLKYEKEINRLKQNDFFFFLKKRLFEQIS